MRKTAVFKHQLFLEHDPGYGHPEQPDRLRDIYRILESGKCSDCLLYPDFEPASHDIIGLNHDPTLVGLVAATSGKMFESMDHDTVTSPKSYQAACMAVGAVISGIDMLMAGSIDNGFSLVRPPGHHAEEDRAMGFCFFNNIAVGARWAMKQHGLKRVMIVDWDVHHGNGTQNSFYSSPEVFYCSCHQSPHFPGTGYLEETGGGAGDGYNLNIPLTSGCGDREFATLFDEIIVPAGREFNPELILVSAGFDIHHADPLGGMHVTPAGFSYITRKLLELADECCDGKLLLSLEGGYDLNGLKEGVFAVLSELYGGDFGAGVPVYSGQEAAWKLLQTKSDHLSIERAREVAKKYWKM